MQMEVDWATESMSDTSQLILTHLTGMEVRTAELGCLRISKTWCLREQPLTSVSLTVVVTWNNVWRTQLQWQKLKELGKQMDQEAGQANNAISKLWSRNWRSRSWPRSFCWAKLLRIWELVCHPFRGALPRWQEETITATTTKIIPGSSSAPKEHATALFVLSKQRN